MSTARKTKTRAAAPAPVAEPAYVPEPVETYIPPSLAQLGLHAGSGTPSDLHRLMRDTLAGLIAGRINGLDALAIGQLAGALIEHQKHAGTNASAQAALAGMALQAQRDFARDRPPQR